MAKRRSGSKGGLCLYLKKKHRWSTAKYNTCVKNSKKRKRGRRRRAYSVNPWAVCSVYNKRGTAKFERCVRHVKARRRTTRRYYLGSYDPADEYSRSSALGRASRRSTCKHCGYSGYRDKPECRACGRERIRTRRR